MRDWLKTAESIAQAAGDLIRDAWERPRTVERKGVVDLVTDTDKKVEAFIVERLRAAFPDHGIVAEEGSGGPALDSGEHVWFVDPIDGTTNFAHGYPHVAVSIGLAQHGNPVLGVVHDVMRRETYSAARGNGATLNGAAIHVSSTSDLDEALLGTGFPYDRWQHAAAYLRFVEDFLSRVQGVRRAGTASLDLCYVAAGRIDGFWELKLKPWDIAAGIIIATEAGGTVSDFAGDPIGLSGQQVLATNGHLHQTMSRILTKRMELEGPGMAGRE